MSVPMNPEKEAVLGWEVADFKSSHVQPLTVSYMQKKKSRQKTLGSLFQFWTVPET